MRWINEKRMIPESLECESGDEKNKNKIHKAHRHTKDEGWAKQARAEVLCNSGTKNVQERARKKGKGCWQEREREGGRQIHPHPHPR